MKTKEIVFAVALLVGGNMLLAQKMEVNTKASNIEWHGKKIGSKHEGNIQLKSGYFELLDGKMVAGNFVADMSSISNTDLDNENYNQKLVGHLKSDDFFGVDKYPTAKFELTKGSEFNAGKAKISGDLTIKGKTESFSFEVVQDGKEYTASIPVDRSKFDVRYGSNSFFDNLGDKAIDDIFTLDIKLVVN